VLCQQGRDLCGFSSVLDWPHPVGGIFWRSYDPLQIQQKHKFLRPNPPYFITKHSKKIKKPKVQVVIKQRYSKPKSKNKTLHRNFLKISDLVCLFWFSPLSTALVINLQSKLDIERNLGQAT